MMLRPSQQPPQFTTTATDMSKDPWNSINDNNCNDNNYHDDDDDDDDDTNRNSGGGDGGTSSTIRNGTDHDNDHPSLQYDRTRMNIDRRQRRRNHHHHHHHPNDPVVPVSLPKVVPILPKMHRVSLVPPPVETTNHHFTSPQQQYINPTNTYNNTNNNTTTSSSNSSTFSHSHNNYNHTHGSSSRMNQWFQHLISLMSSSSSKSLKSSSSSFIPTTTMYKTSTFGSHNNNNNNNRITALLLCLFGTILVLLIIIAYLLVLVLESTSTSTVSSSSSNVMSTMILSHQRHPSSNTNAHLAVTNTNHDDIANRNNDDSEKNASTGSSNTSQSLQIVWLMSFPNSGTSYTSRLVRDVTQTFTASNYADETPEGVLGQRVPVYHNESYGPFWTIPYANQNDYTYPTKYVLTKTHCGIRCSLCSPNEYAETTYSFRRRCLVTKWVEIHHSNDDNNRLTNKTVNIDTTTNHTTITTTTNATARSFTNVYSTYPISHVGKAVHLIRNPFDNVVSRFHLEQHSTKNRTTTTTTGTSTADMSQYTPDRHGFLRYCLSIDFKYIQQEMKYLHFTENKLLQDLWLVPCHADFMRYVEWHNLAFITTMDLHIPTYILHYDWYATTTKFHQVVQDLIQFLQLSTSSSSSNRSPPPFVVGKVYDDYYTIQEKLIVKRAFEFMASSKTWDHIQQYFPDG